MTTPTTIRIDDTDYVRADSIPADIVSDNVLIGRYSRDPETDECTLTDAKVIRRWGTTQGLGQLAKKGPQTNTVLDPCCGVVRFGRGSEILTIDADPKVWP